MIRETELNLFVPAPELLVRLASGDRPLGVRAGPPRIKALRETFFDTSDQTLRRRGMTCKLRQVEGEDPSVVVTVGEGPDSEGITSRSRLTAAAIGTGVFETLGGDSEPATQIQKFVDPSDLRPQIALDIQRLGRVYRGGLLLKPVLLLFFDRITVQMRGNSTVFHELRVRRRREGGPLVRDIARELRDQHHLFPDGLTTLQRAYRLLAAEGKDTGREISPYGLNLALALFSNGRVALLKRDGELYIPTFRGSGEDAVRALTSDLIGNPDVPLLRLGITEAREGQSVVELWTTPDPTFSQETASKRPQILWFPWDRLLEEVGRADLRNPTLIPILLLLSRRKLLGQLPWIDASDQLPTEDVDGPPPTLEEEVEDRDPDLDRLDGLMPLLREIEAKDADLESRLEAASEISKELSRVFFQEVTRLKGRILSEDGKGSERDYVQRLDLMSIRIRGIVDRLYRALEDDLRERLEARDIHFRSWAGLMHVDRMNILRHFTSQQLASMKVAPEWGPSFIPEMPLSGCAIGVMARLPGAESIRFFHIVLPREAPAFLPVPGSKMVLPIEEVVRGYFLTQMPELERAETFMFRFTTGAALVREAIREPEPVGDDVDPGGTEVEPVGGTAEGLGAQGEGAGAWAQASSPEEEGEGGVHPPPVAPEEPRPRESGRPGGLAEDGLPATASIFEPPLPRYVESRQSVVVRILVHRQMPETHQTQLLRALERQVSRRNPMIGWSDLYPVTGPLDLDGIHALLDLNEEG